MAVAGERALDNRDLETRQVAPAVRRVSDPAFGRPGAGSLQSDVVRNSVSRGKPAARNLQLPTAVSLNLLHRMEREDQDRPHLKDQR